MKRFACFVALLLITVPAWSAKNITVAELKNMLMSMHNQSKSDADVASALKQLQLSEELDRKTMNNLAEYVPGPLSTEQIYVLEARSAVLAPPASDLPSAPAPDAAAQKSLLDKAETYTTKIYGELPAVTATKTTLRFQDNVEAVANSSGLSGSATDVSTGSSFVKAYQFVHYINSTATDIASTNGAEKLPSEKDKTQWGANKMIALQEPDPSLSHIFREAKDAGDIKWRRWELINGKQVAVFSFVVAKKKSHFALNVCCFPNIQQAGVARFSSAAMPGGGGAKGNLQTSTDWHNYKAVVPYHGEFFIDPDGGVVVRMITEAELQPSEVVHQQDTRIDYGPVKVGDQTLDLPVRTVVNTEVVPNGESGAGGYSTRRTLFTSEYTNYQLAGGAKKP